MSEGEAGIDAQGSMDISDRSCLQAFQDCRFIVHSLPGWAGRSLRTAHKKLHAAMRLSSCLENRNQLFGHARGSPEKLSIG
jgi:hypothetical protein